MDRPRPGGEPAPAATPGPRVGLLLFAAAREAAGAARLEVEASTVAEALDAARDRFGDPFSTVLARSRVWVNGRPASGEDPLRAGDEVAVLPPVSGGCSPLTRR